MREKNKVKKNYTIYITINKHANIHKHYNVLK